MKKYVLNTITCVILILSLLSITCYATYEVRSDDDSDIHLAIASSSVKDGSTDVPINKVIELKFSKNISDITVCEQNSNKFQLTDSNNNSVGIEVIFPNPKIKENYTEYIFIKPLENLNQNSKYRLTISSKFKSKYQSNLIQDCIINFKTGKIISTEKNATLKDLGNQIISFKITADLQNNIIDNKNTNVTTNEKERKRLIQTIIIIIISILVVAISIIAYFVSKKKTS